MGSSFLPFLIAAGGVTLAEMGDKTQLLAMAFATKYKASKILLGVFIATILNHGLAVALGNCITRLEGIQGWIQGVASLSFILFGLWTLHGDKLDGEDQRKSRYGAVMTVAIAFFIAELGDKTQLATIALATKFPGSPLEILMGTTTGMLIADGIGIIFGVVMGKRIPEHIIKYVSAGMFIVFGLIGSYQVAREFFFLSSLKSWAVILLLAVGSGIASYNLVKKDKNPSGMKLESPGETA